MYIILYFLFRKNMCSDNLLSRTNVVDSKRFCMIELFRFWSFYRGSELLTCENLSRTWFFIYLPMQKLQQITRWSMCCVFNKMYNRKMESYQKQLTLNKLFSMNFFLRTTLCNTLFTFWFCPSALFKNFPSRLICDKR